MIVFIISFLLFFSSCQIKANQNKEEVHNQIKSTDLQINKEAQKNRVLKLCEQTNRNDSLKIYNASEVDSPAIFPMSNSQLLEFYKNEFKYPPIKPINGKGEMELTIDEKGNIIDVTIVKGIHPEVDKEFIRVFKLFPPFSQPAKVNGKTVKSKYKSPITSIAF